MKFSHLGGWIHNAAYLKNTKHLFLHKFRSFFPYAIHSNPLKDRSCFWWPNFSWTLGFQFFVGFYGTWLGRPTEHEFLSVSQNKNDPVFYYTVKTSLFTFVPYICMCLSAYLCICPIFYFFFHESVCLSVAVRSISVM